MQVGLLTTSEFGRASRAQGIHSLQIPCQTHQTRFAARVGQYAQQELPEFHHVLDQSKYQLDRAFAQRIQLAPAARFYPMPHGFHRRWLGGQWRRLGKASERRAMMSFATERDQ